MVVKVQYPGVAQAVQADLKNAGTLENLPGALAGRLSVPDAIAEVKTRFLEEIDYRIEAENLKMFRRHLHGKGAYPHTQLGRHPEFRADACHGRSPGAKVRGHLRGTS